MKEIIKRKFGLTEKGARALIKASFASFLANVFLMSLAMIAIYYSNNILENIDKPALHYLLVVAIGIAVLAVILDTEYVATYNTTYEESANLRFEISELLRELPLSYFSKHNLSDLAQTVMQDVTDIEHALSHSMPRCIAYTTFLTIMAVLLLIFNPLLGLAVIIPMVIGLLLMLLSTGLQKRYTGKYFWKTRETTEAFQESFELHREMKSYGLGRENYSTVSEHLDAAEKLRLRSEISQGIPILLSNTVMKTGVVVIALVAAWMFDSRGVELVFVIGYLMAAIRLADSAAALEEAFAELIYLDARVKRINELRDTRRQEGKDVEFKNYDIELKNVEFSYGEDNVVIEDVSFTARQNQVTAIVGPSGCGKTTILRLISRLYDHNRGSITIGGHEVTEISTDSLCSKVSFVFQDVVLFNSSVLDNIRIGRMDATDEEVREAARLANCDSFVKTLPDGYDTMIGENGSKLSGGERQRISIARALLKNAPILLLDEISSSLDIENEREIQSALNLLIQGKTVLIVSHRLKSVEKADQIIVMDGGRVDAAGRHKDVLDMSGLYRRLIRKSIKTDAYSYFGNSF